MNENPNLNNGGNGLTGGSVHSDDHSIELSAEPVRTSASQPSAESEQQAMVASSHQATPSPYVQVYPQQSYAPPTGEPVHASAHAEAANPAHATHQPGHSIPTGATHGTAAGAGVAAGAAAKKGSSAGKTFLIAFAGALVACALALGVALGFGLLSPANSAPQLGATEATSVEAADVEASLAEAVANKCLPSVVSIDVFATQQSQGGSIYDYLYGYGNSNSGELAETGLGSGVILSEDGYIVTNYHVVSGGEQFKVTIEGEVYEAELVGSEASSDVAVLKVKDGKDFKAIEVADSDNIRVGEWVMSLGSPFGLEQSVATGIVSATSRSQIMDSNQGSYGGSGELTIYPNLIQTDAAINPGNSGGALVDADGALIGINTLITSYSGNYSGVGFAIPSNYAISLAESIIAGEEPTHAQLGITMTTVDSSIAKRYGFPVDSGAYVSSVAEGSGAANAGIEVGDIITEFDGKTVSSSSDLMLDVRTKQPGDVVSVMANRDGEEMQFEVTLGKSEKASAQSESQQNSSSQGNSGSGQGQGQGQGGQGQGGTIEDLLRQFGR